MFQTSNDFKGVAEHMPRAVKDHENEGYGPIE
jgi:hypothetical protein